MAGNISPFKEKSFAKTAAIQLVAGGSAGNIYSNIILDVLDRFQKNINNTSKILKLYFIKFAIFSLKEMRKRLLHVCIVLGSVSDPYHFDLDPDPDPR